MRDDTLISIPIDESTRLREEALSSKFRILTPGDALIRPGQPVEMLYQLLEGEVAMARDLGTPKETRQIFSRVEPDAKDPKGWTPFLGGRYLFTGRASSMHYIALTPCTVCEMSPALIRELYLRRDCVKLVREFIRNSDLPMEMFHRELDKRFDMMGFAGFRKEVLETLLMIEDEYLAGGVDTRAHGREVVRDEYATFACDMIFRLMGDRLKQDGDSTAIEYVPDPGQYR